MQHPLQTAPREWLPRTARRTRAAGPLPRSALALSAYSPARTWPSPSAGDLLPGHHDVPASGRAAAHSVGDKQTRYIPFPRYKLPPGRRPRATLTARRCAAYATAHVRWFLPRSRRWHYTPGRADRYTPTRSAFCRSLPAHVRHTTG